MKEAYNYLKNSINFNANDFVVIGVSGGPDSMALLHMLLDFKKEKEINIVCAHINHNVREESEQEKTFVEKYCKENNITFEYMKIEKYTNDTFSEQEARKIRYKFFEDIIEKYNSKILLTAHHGDDLIETILMRIVRGSTLKGYAGFSKETQMGSYKIIRPLIYCTKEEIEIYNKTNNLSYVTDFTNTKETYTRNRYRKNILPFLKKEDKKVNNKFLKYSELLFEYNEYVDNEMKKYINKVYINNNLYLDEFFKLEGLIKKRIINYIFEDIYPFDLNDINDSHIELLNKLILSKKPNSKINLPNNIVGIKEYNKIIFKKVSNDIESQNHIFDKILLDKDVKISNDRKFVFVKEEESDSNFICRINSTDISLPLYIRNKKDGDSMNIKGMNGTKKIKDIFINSKISKEERDNWPIVVDSKDNIVWLPGLKKSKYNKEKNEKYDIIIKYIIKEEK